MIDKQETEWWITRDDLDPDDPFTVWGTKGEARRSLDFLRAMQSDHTFEVYEVAVHYSGKKLEW